MNCTRCKKPLKRGYYFNTKPYGPECIKKVAGRNVKLHKLNQIRIERELEISESQMGLFDDDTN